ncbi:hypothetical protein [Nostoc sp.]|uniref:hypothetical protein n=1 Tax=Nostoc sp. TaxID=1180 RepID=UPI002FF55626
MSVDFTKFPFPGVQDPHAATLTEAIRAEPVTAGFVVVAVKGTGTDFANTARVFAQALRANAAGIGLADITAYREIRPDELGGAMPFDQAICENVLHDAEKRQATQSDKYPTIKPALKMAERNDIADWTLLAEFETTDQASAAAAAWNKGDESFKALTRNTSSHTVGAFKNTMRYASVSRDPNVIQFFNFFPGPGDVDVLWTGWQEALPWFFETGEMRSSFPLVALDPSQPILVVNYAHFDSIKHFFLGVSYDPNYLDTVTRAYVDRGFKLPMPFFCKIVPV